MPWNYGDVLETVASVVPPASPFTIHGDQYYELHVTRIDGEPGPAFAIKVPQHATAGEPAVGQRLSAQFLMGQVTGTKPL